MRVPDWFEYLFLYPALYAYWKATVKALHSSLSGLVGILALVILTKGGKP